MRKLTFGVSGILLQGIYPTIKDFDYCEEITVAWDPAGAKPVLSYRQRTWAPGSAGGTAGKPMHAEAGFFRVLPKKPDAAAATVELVLSQPNGG